MSDRWQQIKDAFADAAERPPEDRLAYLKECFGKDTELIDEVTSLLAAASEPEDIIEQNAVDLTAGAAATDYTERRFGNYRIVREIGSGGMGAVFLAERDDGEIRMQAALKIVRQSVADTATTERFRRERQILADLRHPNIAALYDGGIGDKGEPFLAMEFVDGISLAEYAAEHDLSIRERLALFVKICSAIAYAHRNLVVHRDIKPSNILVNADGEPKLLDFGLARVFAEGDGTESVLRAFTPAYASPEQIKGERITTASDIYSLGVVLYELLAQTKPLQVEDRTYEQLLRVISEFDPPRPSHSRALSAADQKALAGDLDNIVLKALRKEPGRRYRSAEEMADDIGRYLSGYPVSARRSTLAYRARKFLARHKAAVAAAVAISVLIVGGAAAILRQYRAAEAERTKAEQTKSFLIQMMLTGNPSAGATGYSTSVSEMLDEVATRLAGDELTSQPELKAELVNMLADVYANQGRIELAERHARNAVVLAEPILARHGFSMAKYNLMYADILLQKADYDGAEPIYEEFLPIFRSLASTTADSAKLASHLSNYAVLRRARGDSGQAEGLFRECLALMPDTEQGRRQRSSVTSLLALSLFDQGKFDEAEAIVMPQIGELESRSGPESIPVANGLTLLGSVLMEKGDQRGSQANLRRAESIYRKLLSPDAVALHDNLRLQAQVAYLRGDHKGGMDLIDRVLANYRENSNPRYISFATALTVRGLLLSRLSRDREAEDDLREAVRLRRENLPAGHFMTALTVGAFGECILKKGWSQEAADMLTESYAALERTQGETNPRTLLARSRLDKLKRAAGR